MRVPSGSQAAEDHSHHAARGSSWRFVSRWCPRSRLGGLRVAGFPPAAWLGIGSTRCAFPADEVAYCGRTHAKQGCHFVLGVVVRFVRRALIAAYVIRVELQACRTT
jgi:hypothetical protein